MTARDASAAPGTALDTLLTQGDEPSRREFFRRFLTAWVMVPLAGSPAGLDPGVHMVRGDLSVQVRFWQREPDGPPVLPVFFTQDRLERFAAETWGLRAANFLSLPGRELMALEHPDSLAGAVLDPGGAALHLDRLAMADLAAGQEPGTLARLLVAGELDPESRAEALSLLPHYRFHVIVGAQVETPEDIGLLLFRRPDGGSTLPLFSTPEPLRAFAGRWGLIQADGNISTDYLSGAEILRLAARHGWWLGVDPATEHQGSFAPDEFTAVAGR